MRRQILIMTTLAVALAVLVLGVPLGFVASRLINTDRSLTLERVALAGAVSVSSDALLSGDPVELPPTEDSVELGIYDTRGRLIAGGGPTTLDVQGADPESAEVVDVSSPDEVAVVVPVSFQEEAIAYSRAATPRSTVQGRVAQAWLLMAAAAVGAVGAALLLARTLVRRLTVPLRELTQTAEELGSGDLAARAPRSGIDEIDRTGAALNATAARLSDIIERERRFSAEASHQLRTPLTGLRLTLDTALAQPDADLRQATRDALTITEDLEQTLDDVLVLARSGPHRAEGIDSRRLLSGAGRRWRPRLEAAGRHLRVDVEAAPEAYGSLAGARQILDVLVDNALRHGRGTVTLVARSTGAALAVDVRDEGRTGRPLLPAQVNGATGSRRIGLAMAESLAASMGGRLVHDHTAPSTHLTLLLPTEPPAGHPPAGPRAVERALRGDAW